MRVPRSALGHLVQCPHCEALFIAQPVAAAPVPAEPASGPTGAADSGRQPTPAAVAVVTPADVPPPAAQGRGGNGRAAGGEAVAWVEPLDEGAVVEPLPEPPLALVVNVAFDAGGALRGRYRARLTPEGLCLLNAARRGRSSRRRRGESDDLLLPPGTPARYVGNNRVRVQIDGRRVVLAVSKFGAYHPNLARDVADFLAGDKGPPDPARHCFRWRRLIPAALPLGIPLVAWLGGWLAFGLFLGPLLALVCVALALTGHWRPAARVGVSVALAVAGYAVAVAGGDFSGNLFGPHGLPPSAWVQFSPPDGRFAVFMPGPPQQSTQKAGQPPNEIEVHVFEVIHPGRDVGFYVHYFEAPGMDADEFLRRTRETNRKGFPTGVVTAERAVAANGIQGEEFVLTLPRHHTVVRRTFLHQGRAYWVSVSGTNLDPASHDVGRFLNSFRVMDGPLAPLPGQQPPPAEALGSV
jgi:hypothetical protein